MADVAQQILDALKELNANIVALRARRVSGKDIQVVQGLSEISEKLGTIMAGEFRAGNSLDPGKGFSGVRIAYPPVPYEGETWNIAGVEDDDLQIGIRAEDGKLLAGDGLVQMDKGGVYIRPKIGTSFDDSALLYFLKSGDVKAGYISTDPDGNMYIIRGGESADPDKILAISNADGPVYILPKSRTGNPNLVILFDASPSDAGTATLQVAGDNGAEISAAGRVLLTGRTAGGGHDGLQLALNTANPSENLTDRNFARLYLKLVGGTEVYLVVQINDGGTYRYKYLSLTDTSTSWVHSTSAP